MKKKTFKIVSLSILLLFIVVGVYFYMGMVLMPKTLDDMGGVRYYGAVSYRQVKKNSIDIMMYGNSDLYCGVIPMEIYKNIGATAFNCGAAKQRMVAVRKQIQKSIKRQKLKMIIIETDCMYYPNIKNGGSASYEKIVWTAPFKYHARWKELKLRDFFNAPVLDLENDFLKGCNLEDKICKFDLNPNFMKDVDAPAKPIERSVMEDFDKIYKLCKKEGIQLMLVECPSPSSWSCAKSKGIQQLVEKYNALDENYQIPFLDFNLELEGFDYSLHFKDKGNHCNRQGAMLITNEICNYIQENYEMTDRRGNDKYKSWDNCLEKYENYISKQ